MKKKTQVFYIHGAESHKSNKDYLHFLKTREISIVKKIRWNGDIFDKELGSGFEVIKPRMPLQDNAKYSDWRIYFERYFPYLRDGIILVGGSMGGIFLAKYLSENKFPKKILSTYLVCPPFNVRGGGFNLQYDLSLLEKNSKNLTLLFSKDDDVVPVAHAEKYRNKLPNAKIIIYKSKNGHFKISKFPELVKMIKNDVK